MHALVRNLNLWKDCSKSKLTLLACKSWKHWSAYVLKTKCFPIQAILSSTSSLGKSTGRTRGIFSRESSILDREPCPEIIINAATMIMKDKSRILQQASSNVKHA